MTPGALILSDLAHVLLLVTLLAVTYVPFVTMGLVNFLYR